MIGSGDDAIGVRPSSLARAPSSVTRSSPVPSGRSVEESRDCAVVPRWRTPQGPLPSRVAVPVPIGVLHAHVPGPSPLVAFALAFVMAAAPGCGGSGSGGGGGGGLHDPGFPRGPRARGAAQPDRRQLRRLPGEREALDGRRAAGPRSSRDVVGGTSTRGLFVARPNGQVVTVFAKGDPCPTTNGSSGVINDFRRIWMRPNGVRRRARRPDGRFHRELPDGAGQLQRRRPQSHRRDLARRHARCGARGGHARQSRRRIVDDLIQVTDAARSSSAASATTAARLHGIWAVTAGGVPSPRRPSPSRENSAPGSVSNTLGYTTSRGSASTPTVSS